jgi:hypothetical protein
MRLIAGGLITGALLLWPLISQTRNAPASPAAGPAGRARISILHPANNSVLSIGTGTSFLQDYLALESSAPTICRYSDRNVGYEAMTAFSNPGDGLYQTTRILPAAGKSYTYFIACQAADGSVTPTVELSFAMSGKPSAIPANIRASAHSSDTVEVNWQPAEGQPKQYNVFRDGVLVATKPGGLLDRNLKPDTLYWYSVGAVSPDGHAPVSPAVPVRTPRRLEARPAPSVLLDDFETPLRVMNPHLSQLWERNLWSVFPGGDLSHRSISAGIADVSTEDAHSGKASLKGVMTGAVSPGQTPGGMYLFFYPYTEKDNQWHFLREYIRSGEWKRNTYNRLRFWIKVPSTFAGAFRKGGQANTQIGTFVRSSSGSRIGSGGSESGVGGNHFYHLYNIPYTGEWHQIIMDMHPSHVRGAPGNTEFGDMPNPTGEEGYNYFDLMTTFYVDLDSHSALTSYPSAFYFDDFELYSETNPENTEQIYSLHGVYTPSANEIFVGWSHPKDDDRTRYEVRYSFEDIHKIGWEHANAMPAGVVKPLGDAYNSMEYVTRQVDVRGRGRIMVGIKPQNSALFRQIVIPIRETAAQQRGGARN